MLQGLRQKLRYRQWERSGTAMRCGLLAVVAAWILASQFCEFSHFGVVQPAIRSAEQDSRTCHTTTFNVVHRSQYDNPSLDRRGASATQLIPDWADVHEGKPEVTLLVWSDDPKARVSGV